ncbi:hypothetical protein AMTRI_Chr13g115590 [Amborella trichopoda]
MELLDIPATGAKYTWSNNCLSHPIMTRLDCFLVNQAWAKLYMRGSARALPRMFSDHCPLLWESDVIVCGRGYFKFEMAWIRDNAMEGRIKNAWNNKRSQGWVGFVGAKEVHSAEQEILKWKNDHKVNYKLKAEETMNKIRELYLKEWESGVFVPQDLVYIDSLNKELHDWIRMDETYWRQRSRVKWLKDGDLNTKFFHAMASARKRSNSIQGIKLEGVVEGDVLSMENAIVNHFQQAFTAEKIPLTDLSQIHFSKLDGVWRDWLERPFWESEIKEAVFS